MVTLDGGLAEQIDRIRVGSGRVGAHTSVWFQAFASAHQEHLVRRDHAAFSLDRFLQLGDTAQMSNKKKKKKNENTAIMIKSRTLYRWLDSRKWKKRKTLFSIFQTCLFRKCRMKLTNFENLKCENLKTSRIFKDFHPVARTVCNNSSLFFSFELVGTISLDYGNY